MSTKQFQNQKELIDYLEMQNKRIESLEVAIKEIKGAINDIGNETKENTLFIVEDLPYTGLLSKNFLRRSFTVWGHYFFAQLIIGLFVAAIYFLIFVVILNIFIK